MNASRLAWAAGCAAALAVLTAAAQQAAPAPPAFAPSDLSASGVRSLAANCAACHGTDGKAAPGLDLGLAGISRERFVSRMTAYKEGKAPATVMHQLAKGFSEAEIAALGDYFSKLPH